MGYAWAEWADEAEEVLASLRAATPAWLFHLMMWTGRVLRWVSR